MLHTLLYCITLWAKITVIIERGCDMSDELDYEALGKRLKKYRQQKCLTLENLAERAGCAVSSVSHAERGDKPV